MNLDGIAFNAIYQYLLIPLSGLVGWFLRKQQLVDEAQAKAITEIDQKLTALDKVVAIDHHAVESVRTDIRDMHAKIDKLIDRVSQPSPNYGRRRTDGQE